MNLIFCLCLMSLLSGKVVCNSNFINDNLIKEWLIPNLGAKNTLCNNHSNFYLEELKHVKLWAAEMFDASVKFPNGILYGSTYALGNFDQCIEIKVPYQNEHFVGKYCMAKITVIPNITYENSNEIDFEYGHYHRFYNISAYAKMLEFSDAPTKASRNDIYYSFCIPSSCTNEDLQERLNFLSKEIYKEFKELKFIIKVESNDCHIGEEYRASVGDILFICLIVIVVLLVLACSIYNIFTQNNIRFIRKAPGKWHDLLMCFSLPNNLKKLATKTSNDDGLDCLAGLRVISLFLIIFGHRCMFNFGSPMFNPIFMERMYLKFEAATVLNGPIIVDTFFLISGFLASYFILSALETSANFVKILLIYFHRLIRLTPAYAVVLAFYSTIFVSLGNGPFWHERVGIESQRCQENWWTNILYVNNYVRADKMCMFQSWYITCDMHFFILIPLLTILLKWKPAVGIASIMTLIGASIMIVVASVYVDNEDPILLLYMKLLKDPLSNRTFRNIYIPSHMRASPYFVGVLTGYLKYKMKHTAHKLPKWLTRTAWFLAAVISLGTIHVGFIFYMPEFEGCAMISAIYAGFHHFTFALGVAWLIIAVSSGDGFLIEPILCWKPFILLSRISYTAFLCHGAIQLYSSAVRRQPIYASLFSTFQDTFADIGMAYILGFLLSMLFESPIIGLEKIIVGQNRASTEFKNSKITVYEGQEVLNGPPDNVTKNNIQHLSMDIVQVHTIQESPN